MEKAQARSVEMEQFIKHLADVTSLYLLRRTVDQVDTRLDRKKRVRKEKRTSQ